MEKIDKCTNCTTIEKSKIKIKIESNKTDTRTHGRTRREKKTIEIYNWMLKRTGNEQCIEQIVSKYILFCA